MRIDSWEAEIRPLGWFRLREQSGGGPTVYLQYKIAGPQGQQRLDLHAVAMRAAANEPLSGRVWRRIPLTQMEELVTAFVFGPVPQEPLPADISWADSTEKAFEMARGQFFPGYFEETSEEGNDAPSLCELDCFFEEHKEAPLMAVFDQFFPSIASDILVDDAPSGTPARRIPQVKAPEGRLTDDFLKDVADAYRFFTDANQSPGPAIADMSGVPVRTVHRWIYQARKRGILAPARSGRAG